jgi:hypothetical protein
LTNFDSSVSEWTYHAKDESYYNKDLTWSDYTYSSKPEDSPALRRKVVIGNSWLVEYDTLFNFVKHSYYENKGYSHVGFRYVKVQLTDDVNKKNNEGGYPTEYLILKKWGLKKR